MGADFTALLPYAGLSDSVLDTIADWEFSHDEPALAAVVECGRRSGFAFVNYSQEPSRWRSRADYDQILPLRPNLPTLDASLELPSGFDLTFGEDAVLVYHVLRWLFFVTEPEWQSVMLGAVRRFCAALGAHECIITSDEHPAVIAFQRGLPIAEALRNAEDQGEGEVASIDAMYEDAGVAEELAMLGPDGELYEIPLWDSHGYWRYVPQ